MKFNKYLFIAIISFAVLLQLIIISYSQITGYIQIPNVLNFFIRLLIGSTISSIFGLVIVYLNLISINLLDKVFPIPKKLLVRIPLELLLAAIAGIIVGTSATLFSELLFGYDDGLLRHIINNSLMSIIINFIVILIIESFSWFMRGQESKLKSEELEKENTLIRFETLKSQLNPHFLFNSLNVLSSLIKSEPQKAQNFVDEFSSVYRYTLDVIENPVVEFKDELEYARSFLYLQKIRFEEALIVEINVDASKLNLLVPPLALQTLLENAFKHNKVSTSSPLQIKIYDKNDHIIVENNLQLKLNSVESKGIGLSNLLKRYELLGNSKPRFSLTEDKYIAEIPLISEET
jgi:sensor histidine kinase YesM